MTCGSSPPPPPSTPPSPACPSGGVPGCFAACVPCACQVCPHSGRQRRAAAWEEGGGERCGVGWLCCRRCSCRRCYSLPPGRAGPAGSREAVGEGAGAGWVRAQGATCGPCQGSTQVGMMCARLSHQVPCCALWAFLALCFACHTLREHKARMPVLCLPRLLACWFSRGGCWQCSSQ